MAIPVAVENPSKVKVSVRSIIFLLFPRFPFLNAITLLMLLGERAKRENYPPLDPYYIYGNLGLFVICGSFMTIEFLRTYVALAHAVQLGCLAVSILLSSTFYYTEWVKVQMVHRIFGCAGFFVLYGFFMMKKPRSRWMLRTGETLVGFHLLAATYAMIESDVDREAFLALVPGGKVAMYVYILLMATCALCYLPGLFVRDMTFALVLLQVVNLVFVDTSFEYWESKKMDYWNQVRIVCDDVCLLLGALMFVLCTRSPNYEKPIPNSDKEADKAKAE